MRVVIVGSSGQLGQELSRRLGDGAIALTRADLDLSVPEQASKVLARLQPEIVWNTAAYNFVEQAGTDREAAWGVNVDGVRALAESCERLSATLVHFSTDYVFGGDRERRQPYAETDPPAPVNAYGQSKLDGEEAVRASGTRHFVIRTCGLYGSVSGRGKGRNFVTTMLRLGREQGRVRVVGDQVCTPSYAKDLAAAALALVATNQFGLYHWTNHGECSWAEFARAAFEFASLPVDVETISTAEYGGPAVRPSYTVLSTAKIESLGLPQPRAWQDALREYVCYLNESSRLA